MKEYGTILNFLGPLLGAGGGFIAYYKAKRAYDQKHSETSFDRAEKVMDRLERQIRELEVALERERRERLQLEARVDILERENHDLRAENLTLRGNAEQG